MQIFLTARSTKTASIFLDDETLNSQIEDVAFILSTVKNLEEVDDQIIRWANTPKNSQFLTFYLKSLLIEWFYRFRQSHKLVDVYLGFKNFFGEREYPSANYRKIIDARKLLAEKWKNRISEPVWTKRTRAYFYNKSY